MRQVLSTTGGTGTLASGATIDYTVGETIIPTFSSGSPFTIKTLTQGFQQPENVLSVTEVSTNSTCLGANNGTISLNAVSNSGTVLVYTWSPTIAGATNTVSNLAPGTYFYTVTDTSTTFSVSNSVTITEDAVSCVTIELTFYSGLTPNGDGNNDTWVIDGITAFPENEVSIFNRWGELVWNGKNYDNTAVVWNGTRNKNNRLGNTALLPDATYFYVVEAGGKNYKGWIELTH